MNPVTIAVDAALTAIGVGKVAGAILWGALLIWKVYLLISGKSDRKSFWTYIDLLVCMIGIAFSGAAKATFTAFKTAGGAITKIPASILRIITNVIGKGAKGTFNLMIKPIEWLGSVFGAGASKMIQTFKSSFNGIFDDIAKMFAAPASSVAKPGFTKQLRAGIKSDITKPWQAASTAQKVAAAKKGATMGLAFYGASQGLHKGVEAYVKNKEEKQQQQLAQQVVKSFDDETIKASIDNDPSIAAALAQMKQ
jgi:hypothetical protein